MATETKLGRITAATFGRGGYQDVQFGLFLTFEGKSWGVCASKATWDPANLKPNGSGFQWTEDGRSAELADLCRFLSDTLKAAKKEHVGQLVGVPVEVTFEGNMLKAWRVLDEVL